MPDITSVALANLGAHGALLASGDQMMSVYANESLMGQAEASSTQANGPSTAKAPPVAILPDFTPSPCGELDHEMFGSAHGAWARVSCGSLEP